MSSNMDDSDGNSRVTRRSATLRRMASNESLTDLESRADTPTLTLHLKKLDTISENVSTSAKKANPLLNSPRRTRKISVESVAVASPLRRTTRAMSNEREISSPLPIRSARRSAVVIESDTDDTTASSVTPGNPKSARKKRMSVISPPIGQIEEESEGEKQEEEEEASTTLAKGDAAMLADELELRTRSISKSPNNKTSLNGSLTEATKSNEASFNLDESKVEEKPRKFFKNREKGSNVDDAVESDVVDEEHSQELPPIEKFTSKRRMLSQSKTDFSSVFEKFANGDSLVQDAKTSPAKSANRDEQQGNSATDKIDEEMVGSSVSNTPIRARRSIHNGSSADAVLDEVAKLMEDFVPEETPAKTPKSSKKADKSFKETPVKATEISFAKSPKSSKKADKSLIETPVKAEEVENISFAKSPKSAKKADKSLKEETPAKEADMKETSFVKTPKSAKKVENLDETLAIKTPKSSKKADKSFKETPAKAEEVEELINLKTPKSTKKAEKSPKTASKSPKATNGDSTVVENAAMDISQHDESDMEISLLTKSSSVKRKSSGSLSKSGCESIVIEQTSFGQELTMLDGTTKSPRSASGKKNQSFKSYIEQVSDSAAKSRRKSLVIDSSGEDEAEAELEVQKSPEKKSLSRSWSQSVVQSAGKSIDKLLTQQPEKQVVKSSVQRKMSISSDESEDEHEANLFIDEEAEVGSEESITESELNYRNLNEIPDEGESIGSQDSNELDSDEEEEDADSFIVDDHDISDTYSMDSHEKEIELSPAKPKRKSRIIIQSDSEDDQPIVKENTPLKSPKLRKSIAELEPEANGEENGENGETVSPQEEVTIKMKKRKRESLLNDSVVAETKRAKISLDVSEIKPMDNETEEDSSDDEAQVIVKSKKPKKVEPECFDLQSVAKKCDELMGKHNEAKRLNIALKREKKALKLALKQKEALKEKEDAKAAAGENLDSSAGSNKENSLKKKKKNKAKKQKLVDDLPEKKEDFAASVTKLSEKLERKRQKKLEKKLAKQLQESAPDSDKKSNEAETGAASAVTKSKKSKGEKSPAASELAVQKENSESKKSVEAEQSIVGTPKDKKKKKKSKENHEEADESASAKKSKKQEVEPVEEVAEPVEKKKKHKKHVEAEPTIAEVPKPKKKSKENRKEVDENDSANRNQESEEVAEPSQKKKSKKRKFDDAIVPDQDEVDKKKKKLNVLKQIEDPWQHQLQPREANINMRQEPDFAAPLASQKLKKIIPQNLEVLKKKRKKKSAPKVIPEPATSLPRPVWTSSGIFVEQPISPYKFKSTSYVPISASASCSTKFGVMTFEAKKKKKQAAQQQQQHPADFKTQMMFRNKKDRDGSIKNIRGLLGSRNTN